MHYLKGLKKGYIEVIDRTKRNGRVYWKCICHNCGKEFYMRTDKFLNSNKGDCGCLNNAYSSIDNTKEGTLVCENVSWKSYGEIGN